MSDPLNVSTHDTTLKCVTRPLCGLHGPGSSQVILYGHAAVWERAVRPTSNINCPDTSTMRRANDVPRSPSHPDADDRRDTRERVLFIGTRFSNLYTSVDTPARGRSTPQWIRQPEAAWWRLRGLCPYYFQDLQPATVGIARYHLDLRNPISPLFQ